MKLCTVLGVLALALATVSCRQADVRTAAIYVPGMKTDGCANIIIKALATEQGIAPAQVTVRLDARTIEVRYDSLKLSLKNLEHCVADVGFSANEIPAKPEAQKALPPDCR